MTKITKEQILKGIGFEKVITLDAYDKAEIAIHPLSDRQLQEVIGIVEKHGFDAQSMLDGSKQSLSGSYLLFLEIARRGICDPEIASVVDSMSGAVVQIGSEIMQLTSGSTQGEVKSF